MQLKYLDEFNLYLREIKTKPVRPSDRAKILFGFDNRKIIHILTELGISSNKQMAIKMVADGSSYIDVSKVFNCSSDTMRKWINKTYIEVCSHE